MEYTVILPFIDYYIVLLMVTKENLQLLLSSEKKILC